MNPIIKFIPFIFLSMMGTEAAVSQTPPSWISYETRKQLYPDDKFLTGFSSQVVRKNDNPRDVQKVLLGNARTQLIESLNISISSTASLHLENNNSKTSEIFKQASTSTSEADIAGMTSDEYYNLKTKEAFAFVCVKKADLLALTQKSLNAESAQLAKKIEIAQQYALATDPENAMKAYLACFSLLRKMEGRVALLLTLGHDTGTEQIFDFENKVNCGISALKTASHTTPDEVCFFIAEGLKNQLPDQYRNYGIILCSFTYMASRIGSEFSARFSATLQTKLLKEGFVIRHPEIIKENPENNLELSGTFWPDGKNLRIIVDLADKQKGNTIASIEDFIPMSWLADRNIRYIPDNFESAMALEKEFSKEEITDVGLVINLWTNKGKASPVFKSNEKMQVYVQVNQPCFIRLIYFLADGRKCLLQDSRFIDEDKVNRPYLIPKTFRCSAPYGAEVLQLVAQSEQFTPLNTVKEGEYDIILDTDKQIIAATRGMKKEKPALMVAEKRLNTTTVEQ